MQGAGHSPNHGNPNVYGRQNGTGAGLITIGDVERLAKAGVVMPWADLRDRIIPDPPRETATDDSMMPRPLADFIWDRWKRGRRADQYNSFMTPYQLFVTEQGDKAYVFVQPQNSPPMIIEDERCLFPSDALMAKLALLEQTK